MADASRKTLVVLHGEGQWTVMDAVRWIVYRTDPALPITPALLGPDSGQGLWRLPDLVDYLEACAEGREADWPRAGHIVRPNTWPPHPDDGEGSADSVRALAARKMAELRLTAEALLALCRREEEWFLGQEKVREEQDRRFETALRQLNRRVRVGDLVAWGWPGTTRLPFDTPPIRERIPPHTVDGVRAIDLHGDYGVQRPLRQEGQQYSGIVVEAADVMRLWPADTGGTESTMLPEGDQSHAGVSPVTSETRVQAVYSVEALGAWLMEKVHSWPKNISPPIETKLRRMAEDHFGPIPRDRFREIRKIRTPPEWRKRGPRGR